MTPPINRNARASRSEINNPPTPRKRGKREGEIDDLLNELRRIPERQRAVEVLLDPLLRQRRFDAPDKVFALGQLADWASKHPDDVLADGLRRTLATRDVTVRPSDIEKALKEAIAHSRKLAPNRRAMPSQLAHADPEVVAKGDQVRHGLKAELGADVFESWFQGIEFERISGRRLIASVPVKFIKSWIENHYMPALQKCSATVFPGVEKVDVIVRTQQPNGGGHDDRPATLSV